MFDMPAFSFGPQSCFTNEDIRERLDETLLLTAFVTIILGGVLDRTYHEVISSCQKTCTWFFCTVSGGFTLRFEVFVQELSSKASPLSVLRPGAGCVWYASFAPESHRCSA